MTREEIINWIVNIGGVCPTPDNHFGGPPVGANSELKLMIQQRPVELASLIEFFLEKKKFGEHLDYYVEIGPCAGGTTRAMYNFLEFKEIMVIDDNGASIGHGAYIDRGVFNRAENLKDLPVYEIIGTSNDPQVIEKALDKSKIQQYDIILIDGDHSYDGVKNDTINYLPTIRPGGYVVFHDTVHIPDIVKWTDELSIELPNVVKVAEFQLADLDTPQFPDGIGLTVFQKIR